MAEPHGVRRLVIRVGLASLRDARARWSHECLAGGDPAPNPVARVANEPHPFEGQPVQRRGREQCRTNAPLESLKRLESHKEKLSAHNVDS
jgi:hypothetical protein